MAQSQLLWPADAQEVILRELWLDAESDSDPENENNSPESDQNNVCNRNVWYSNSIPNQQQRVLCTLDLELKYHSYSVYLLSPRF